MPDRNIPHDDRPRDNRATQHNGGAASDDGAPKTSSPPVFSARLTPHRSLSKQGFLLLMAVFAGASFAAGATFTALGAWPVLGFFGLDVVLLYLLFRWNFNAAEIYERVELKPGVMTLYRGGKDRSERMQKFNPYWVRVILRETGLGANALFLRSHGLQVEIGSFLSPRERANFASALDHALLQHR